MLVRNCQEKKKATSRGLYCSCALDPTQQQIQVQSQDVDLSGLNVTVSRRSSAHSGGDVLDALCLQRGGGGAGVPGVQALLPEGDGGR